MRLNRRILSGREKDEESIRLLTRLRDKLYADDVSVARRAAFNLSWMQEDGLDILKEALFGKAARRTKSAAAYGLRKMHGRMKKIALGVFKQGLKHADGNIRDVCNNALSQIGQEIGEKAPSQGPAAVGKFEIKEVPKKGRKRKRVQKKGQRQHPLRGKRSSRR